MRTSLGTFGLLFVTSVTAVAQNPDTLLTWRTYSQEAQARVRVFDAPSLDRPWTVVVDEVPTNRGPVVTDDARFLAETIGRTLGRDPAEMTFVFRFTPASFCEGAHLAGRTLLLRATFTRARSGRLGTPNWRVITRDELATLTDRALF
jgi:hypothetical protein